MHHLFSALAQFVVLAQVVAAPAPGAGGPPPPEEGPSSKYMFPMIAMLLVLGYFMLFRPEKQKQNAHKEMMANLKKSDRVVTVGGIKAVVANVHREADEVTLTIDESTGTKIRVTLGSIARLEGDEPASEKK